MSDFKLKNIPGKSHQARYKRGMTYVELIVVLTIFSVMSSVVLFNYKTFQARVDVKNLANDIALKISEAQKSATSGKWNNSAASGWKPAYGIFFGLTTNNTSFTYFADLNNNNLYSDFGCTGECISTINITKGNYISRLDVFYQGGTSTQVLNDLHLTFTRPNYGMVVNSSTPLNPNISYVQITVSSPQAVSATIKLYSSGRIQIN